MPSDKLIAKKENGVGWIILNNLERHNAISLEMWTAAMEAMQDFRADKSVRVVVVTGAGGKAFASGADISKFKDERQEAAAVAHYQQTTQKAYDTVLGMPIPTIAMIRGYCIGGGTALAVCCDMRICTENSKFGVPAAKLGLGYGMNRAKPLVDLIGPAYAKEMFFTGRQFTAQEAEKMGLVNRVVPDDQLQVEAFALAKSMAEGPTLALRYMKDNLDEALLFDFATACDHEAERLIRTTMTGDHREAVQAFIEKRKAVIKGN
jgi:enoyl-CoA hydratase/carnithine racemase